jgi:N-acetylmuramoyl-L-alanine amidase
MLTPLCLGALLLAAPPAPSAAAAGDLYPQRSTAPIIVIHPPEGLSMGPAEGEFILGSVSDPKAPFLINETTVAVHPNGAFLAWLPVHPGSFTFLCTLNLAGGATTFARTISVAASAQPLPPKPLSVDADSLWPQAETVLRPGDTIPFRMRASPGGQARCRLGGGHWAELRETSPGVYEGLQAVPFGAEAAPEPAECHIKNGWASERAASRGRAALTSAPPLVGVVKNQAVLRTAPGAGYMAYPPPGTRLAVTGRQGAELRVSLSPSLEGWIDAKDVELQPAGPPLPRTAAESIHTSATDRGASVRIGLGDRIPFTVTAGDEGLTLRLYNTVGRTNWMVYDPADSFVREVRWRQEGTGVVAVLIRLDPAETLWGWQAAFEGSALRLDLRRAPTLAPAPASPLKGVAVVLDPGHMPSAAGATGPLGTREMDANFAIAKAAAALLARRGALPVMTRAANDQEVGLAERPRQAVERRGDVFVSIHNNAVGDGVNPFASPRGFSVFYHHPQSLSLADRLYRAYEKRVPLPGEGLRYGNLLVARLTAMPAVLVESAYMILPDQEEKLNDPAFRERLAEAIADGLESFLADERARQAAAKRTTPKKKTPPQAPAVIPSPKKVPAGSRPAKPPRKAAPAKAAPSEAAPLPPEDPGRDAALDEILSEAPGPKP